MVRELKKSAEILRRVEEDARFFSQKELEELIRLLSSTEFIECSFWDLPSSASRDHPIEIMGEIFFKEGMFFHNEIYSIIITLKPPFKERSAVSREDVIKKLKRLRKRK